MAGAASIIELALIGAKGGKEVLGGLEFNE
jgi:hypothetical protein